MNLALPTLSTTQTRRLWVVLRAAMFLLWLVAAVGGWWITPRSASYDHFKADVGAGRVSAYQWGDSVSSGREWFGGSELRSFGKLGPLLVWRTPDHRLHRIDVTSVNGPGEWTTGAIEESEYSDSRAVPLAQELRAAGLDSAGDVGRRDRAFVGALGIVFGLTFLIGAGLGVFDISL